MHQEASCYSHTLAPQPTHGIVCHRRRQQARWWRVQCQRPARTSFPGWSALSSSATVLVSELEGPLSFARGEPMTPTSVGLARRGKVDARLRSFIVFSNSRSALAAFSTSLMRKVFAWGHIPSINQPHPSIHHTHAAITLSPLPSSSPECIYWLQSLSLVVVANTHTSAFDLPSSYANP